MRLLIVDNETIRQRNLRSILTSLGYKSADIEGFDDPVMAVNSVKKKKFDCAFVCLHNPRMSGIETLKHLRESLRAKAMPIVIYAAQASREDVVEAIQAGANGFLSYPLSVSDVEDVLKKAIAKAKKAAG